jgi:hypothetical protein
VEEVSLVLWLDDRPPLFSEVLLLGEAVVLFLAAMRIRWNL